MVSPKVTPRILDLFLLVKGLTNGFLLLDECLTLVLNTHKKKVILARFIVNDRCIGLV